MIYLYAGLGLVMLVPIVLGLQATIAVAELERAETAAQGADGTLTRAWQQNLQQKTSTALAQPGAVVPEGYERRSYMLNGQQRFCVVPQNSPNERCLGEPT